MQPVDRVQFLAERMHLPRWKPFFTLTMSQIRAMLWDNECLAMPVPCNQPAADEMPRWDLLWVSDHIGYADVSRDGKIQISSVVQSDDNAISSMRQFSEVDAGASGLYIMVDRAIANVGMRKPTKPVLIVSISLSEFNEGRWMPTPVTDLSVIFD